MWAWLRRRTERYFERQEIIHWEQPYLHDPEYLRGRNGYGEHFAVWPSILERRTVYEVYLVWPGPMVMLGRYRDLPTALRRAPVVAESRR